MSDDDKKYRVGFTRLPKLKDCYWSIYLDDEFIFKATLDNLWGEYLGEDEANRTVTREYGLEVITQIRKRGIRQVYKLMTGKKMHEKVVVTFPPNRLDTVE